MVCRMLPGSNRTQKGVLAGIHIHTQLQTPDPTTTNSLLIDHDNDNDNDNDEIWIRVGRKGSQNTIEVTGETLADKVAKKKVEKKEPGMSPTALEDIDAMRKQDPEMYNQAVAQYMKTDGEVATDEDVEKVVVIFQELMEARL